MATTYLTRTPSSGAATQKATFSFWVKKTNTTGTPNLFRMYTNAQQYVRIRFESSNKISFIIINSDSYVVQLVSTQVFRDTSAWYNIVCNMDTTQATASDRAKIYVNGERITAYDTATYPPTQNANIIVTPSGTANHIGTQLGDSPSYFEGCMSHVNFTDGYVYQASEFGETDSTTGEWKIKTSPSVTYGTNGFFILKDGNSVTDQSGNSNNFTVAAGTLTNTEDCPSNVFCTMNPLDNYYANSTFSNGNTTIVTNSGNTTYNTSTLGIPPTMKCYWEVKFNTVQSANGEVGIVNTPTTGSSGGAYRLYYQTYGISVNDGGAIWSANADTGITLGTLSTSDIVCFAWDGVNQALYVRKNGDAWINSGNPTSGASKTGAVKSFSGTSLTMFPAVGDQSGANAVGTSTNFGNGFFGTTAVSSAGTNASGIGIFEYDVPTGYTALSTKGLNA